MYCVRGTIYIVLHPGFRHFLNSINSRGLRGNTLIQASKEVANFAQRESHCLYHHNVPANHVFATPTLTGFEQLWQRNEIWKTELGELSYYFRVFVWLRWDLRREWSTGTTNCISDSEGSKTFHWRRYPYTPRPCDSALSLGNLNLQLMSLRLGLR